MEQEKRNSLSESQENIQAGLNEILEDNEAALCMIAPYIPEQISPNRSQQAEIGLMEELRMEQALDHLEDVEKLKLIVHSYGGRVSSSFKIARALRKDFDAIEVYVPHLALSGGTLISLVGEEIVMGQMSQMSPIDPQYTDGDNQYSVNAMIRMYEKMKERFSELHEQDAPYPIRALADKIDPVDLQEKIDTSEMMRKHAKTILTKHNFIDAEEAERILNELMEEYPTHSYTITYDEASKILPDDMVTHEEDKELDMQVMRSWLHSYIEEADSNHIIKYWTKESNDEGDSE